jgi:hypothetical protein
MLIRWLLFSTRGGEWLLALLEKTTGLAIVQAEWLANQPSGVPRSLGGE